MDTWDAITSRRNVREFAARPLPSEDLHRILEAARRAPSSQNRQHWDFIVVTERAQLEELSKVSPGAGHVAKAAAAVALIMARTSDPADRERSRFDLGQAAMAMMITAADRDIGSGHAGVRDQEQAKRVLGLPEDREAAYLIDFGYPLDRPLKPIRNPARRAFDDVIHTGRW